MKRWFAVLTVVATLLLSMPQTAAQSSPLQELRITITDYEAEKVTPGSTFKVRFTVHKPAGIKVTDSALAAHAYYSVDNKTVDVFYSGFGGSDKIFSLPFLDEQDVNQELEIKILENAPIDQLIYIDVWWFIADVNVSINENENQVTVISGENTFTTSIVETAAYANFTNYYLTGGWLSRVFVRSNRPDRLYVVGRIADVKILPNSSNVFLIIAAAAGAILLCAMVSVAVYHRKKLVSKEEVLTGPE